MPLNAANAASPPSGPVALVPTHTLSYPSPQSDGKAPAAAGAPSARTNQSSAGVERTSDQNRARWTLSTVLASAWHQGPAYTRCLRPPWLRANASALAFQD